MKTKICYKCKKERCIGEFSKDKHAKDGLQNKCKNCVKQHYLEHREEISLNGKQYYIEHKEESNFKSKKWYWKHKEESKLYHKKYNLEHPEENKLRYKKYYSRNREKILLRNRQHDLEHKDEINLRRKKHLKQRYEMDALHRTLCCLRSRMNYAYKSQGVKKTLRTVELLGCIPEFYQNYLQSHFKPGMTKENNGKRKWVQHHVIGCNKFNLMEPDQQKLCFHYTNIIPMWEDEHKEWHKNHPD